MGKHQQWRQRFCSKAKAAKETTGRANVVDSTLHIQPSNYTDGAEWATGRSLHSKNCDLKAVQLLQNHVRVRPHVDLLKRLDYNLLWKLK